MIISHTNAADPYFAELCCELDRYLNDLVGGEENRAEYLPLNTLRDLADVVIAYEQNLPVGCASFKKLDADTAELKRVYVRPADRGNGIGRQLLLELESSARQQGYRRLVLETGKPLLAATHLYKMLGYRAIENYGPYANMPESVCMEKQL